MHKILQRNNLKITIDVKTFKNIFENIEIQLVTLQQKDRLTYDSKVRSKN